MTDDELTEHEKEAKERLDKRWPKERANRIWKLYIMIRKGERKFVSDLSVEEMEDADQLKACALIRFVPKSYEGREAQTRILPLRV